MHCIFGSDTAQDKSARPHLAWSFSSVSQNSGLVSIESMLFLNRSLGESAGVYRGVSVSVI